MEDPVEQPVTSPWRELGWECLRSVVAYLVAWPFMCHAGLVLGLAWIASYLHLNVGLVCTLGFFYLLHIENRQRVRLRWTIGHEERKKASKMRMAEGETVRWLNEITETLWPVFLEDFASQMLLVPMNSFLERFCKPWTAKKLILQNLSLGKTPPIVTMVRLLDETVEDDDLAMEASLEWHAAKDMVANLAVQVRRRVGLGIWANLHLRKLQLEGKVKVGVKFKPDGWPMIERIRFCFARAPYIDLEAHPIYNSGVDVSELPGIASYLDRLVADSLSQSLVEPNHMVIDVVKLVNDEKLMKLLRPQGHAQLPKGDWFSFRGNPPAADVTLTILEATNLRVGDLNGYSDPYVKVTLNGTQHRETKVIWKTLNPKWNETFCFSISSWDQPNTMLLKVRDKDHIFDDQLGYQIVDLVQYRDGREHDIWLPLGAVDTGKIHLLITIVERQTDSQSSEDVSNTNSTFLEKPDQLMSHESDRPVPPEGVPMPPSPGSGLSQAPAASPKDRASTRQRVKNLKTGKALSTDPEAPENNSGKKVGRQRSGIFSSYRSSRKLETPRGVGSDREEYSPMASSGVTSARSSAPMEADTVADPSTDDTTINLNVGFGEPGAVKICHFGDIQPTPWPSQRVAGSQQTEDVSNSEEGTLNPECLTNIEEDRGAHRKLRSAGLALHGRFHRNHDGVYRTRKGVEKDAETGPPLQTPRKFSTTANGATVHLTLDPSEGQPAYNSSSTPLPLRSGSTATIPLNVDQGGEVMDGGVSIGDRDPDKHHFGTKAKGLFAKAAGQFSHQISKTVNRHRKTEKEEPVSSEEVSTSGELTPIGKSGRDGPATKELGSEALEAPVTGPGILQQQIPSTSNQSEAASLSPSRTTSSVPPNRPPPGLPPPVAPINLQADNETTAQSSSPPLRPFPTHSGDVPESSPPQGQEPLQTQSEPLPTPSGDAQERSSTAQEREFLQTQGLPQPAPPRALQDQLEGASISSL